jgi:SAM-dependent methyltransferase
MKCRHCDAKLELCFADLGFAPPSNAYLTASDLDRPEQYYPLKVLVCTHCWLVQTKDFTKAETLFDENYAYFSSTSKSWLAHAQAFCDLVTTKFHLDAKSHVVEIASNDGYLLKNFVAAGIPCLGIEPTKSTSDAAAKLNIPQCQAFFGQKLAQDLVAKGKEADLIVANNVLAHVPDINDFCAGLKTLLKAKGVISFEFPHLQNLIKYKQFDTIYHEHFSYLSLVAVVRILRAQGLEIFDVTALPTHGGSLRVFAGHHGERLVEESVINTINAEHAFGLESLETYEGFQREIETMKDNLLKFLLEAKSQKKRVAAYGAAAKGNTLLNFAGIKPDLIEFVVDAAPAKQGKFLPGSHIPIVAPEQLEHTPVDILLILPWNIAAEVSAQNEHLRVRGTQMYITVPEIKLV